MFTLERLVVETPALEKGAEKEPSNGLYVEPRRVLCGGRAGEGFCMGEEGSKRSPAQVRRRERFYRSYTLANLRTEKL